MITLLQRWALLREAIADPVLSPRAKMVLAALLDCLNSRTGCCHPRLEVLAEKTSCKRRVVSDAIGELVAGGWMTSRRRRGSAIYTLNFDRAGSTEDVQDSAPLLTDHDVRNSAHHTAPDDVRESAHQEAVSDHDDVRNPACLDVRDSAHLLDSESSSLTQNQRNRTRESDSVSVQPVCEPVEESDRRSKAQRLPRRAKTRGSPTGEAFAEFWKAYPRKIAKLDARKAFDEAVKGGKVTATELVAGAQRYAEAVAATGIEPRFIKQPAGWIRTERWTDAPDVSAVPPTAGRPKRSALVEAVLNTVRQT